MTMVLLSRCFISSARRYCTGAGNNASSKLYHVDDWKPGPYPKTKEEREAAAHKYGLIPEDYEPHPDDGTGKGDYPLLPTVSGFRKDNFHNWDFLRWKRDYREPIHHDYDIMVEERLDVSSFEEHPVSYNKMFFSWIGTFLVFMGLCWISDKYAFFHPVKPKQWPYKEQGPHYTFAPKEDGLAS